MPDIAAPLVIDRLVAGGWGLGHQGNLVTFVRGAVPGETLIVRPFVYRRGYQKAQVEKILVQSPDRVPAPCPQYGNCGGCHLQHIRYDVQLSEKQHVLEETLGRIGHIHNLPVFAPVPSPFAFGYRSWIRFMVQRHKGVWQLGLNRAGSHDFVSASCCLLIPESMRNAVHAIENQLETNQPSSMRINRIELRQSTVDGSVLLLLRGHSEHVSTIEEWFDRLEKIPKVVGLVWQSEQPKHGRQIRQRIVRGQNFLCEQFHDLVVEVGDRSFMQGNWPLFEKIGQTLMEWAGEHSRHRVLELFAGIGCLGLLLARQGFLMTQVELNPFAVADARKNARVNKIGGCRFRVGQAEEFLVRTRIGEYDLLLLDPPRTGLSSDSVASILRLEVPRIFYLSCDAPTLARDLRRFVESGYDISRLQAFDLFPQTAHLETLVELVRS